MVRFHNNTSNATIDSFLLQEGICLKPEDIETEKIATHKGRTVRKPDREKRREDRRTARVRCININQLRKARRGGNISAQEEIEKMLRIG